MPLSSTIRSGEGGVNATGAKVICLGSPGVDKVPAAHPPVAMSATARHAMLGMDISWRMRHPSRLAGCFAARTSVATVRLVLVK